MGLTFFRQDWGGCFEFGLVDGGHEPATRNFRLALVAVYHLLPLAGITILSEGCVMILFPLKNSRANTEPRAVATGC